MDGLSALPWTARWCQGTLPCPQSVDKRCRRSHGRVERLAMDGPLVSRYLTLPLFLTGIVSGVDVVYDKRPHTMHLERRCRLCQEEMMHLCRDCDITAALYCPQLRLIPSVAHAQRYGARFYGQVLITRVPVRHNLVAGRNLRADNKRSWLRRIAGDHCHLRAGGQARRPTT